MNADPNVQAAIQEIVRRLVAGYRPLKIILFGSYAYGQPDQDSDIDLLVIKNTDQIFWHRLKTVRDLAYGAHPRIPLGPLVLTPAELDERLIAGDQFIAEIIERGEVLHAA